MTVLTEIKARYPNNKVNLTGIDAGELTRLFELPSTPLLLKHEDCCLVWLPCEGVLYAVDRDEIDTPTELSTNIFSKGNFAEVIGSYYEDTSELVAMFKSIIKLNTSISSYLVSDSYDNCEIELGTLIKQLEERGRP